MIEMWMRCGLSSAIGRFVFGVCCLCVGSMVFALPGINTQPVSSRASIDDATSFSDEFKSPYSQLEFLGVKQSSDASSSNAASKAVDGATGTFSLTQDLLGSSWSAELGRPHQLDRIELVNRAAPNDAEMEGLTLSLMNLDDQVVFEMVLDNPGPGATAVIDFPEGLIARSIRIGLSGTRVNGEGNYRVGLAEVRLIGLPNIPFSPEPFVAGEIPPSISVMQSTTFSSSFPAEQAIDNNAGTFSHTDNSSPNNYWMADLGTVRPITEVELVNRNHSASARMGGLTLRILDDSSNEVVATTTTDPGPGGTYTFSAPANTSGRYVWIGLEDGATNERGDYVVCLAEVAVSDGSSNWLGTGDQSSLPEPTENVASSKRSYMLRISDTDPPASNVNDGDYTTESRTASNAFDGYWEVDLGESYALYGLRAIAPNDLAVRLNYTTVRLYDEDHDSVYSQAISGDSSIFDIDLRGPVVARYVRIGLEDKTRPNENNATNKYEIGFKEVEVFGRPLNEVGILSFATSETEIASGESSVLNWSVEGVTRVEIHPAIGSVGAHTASDGEGRLSQTPFESTEFILIGTNHTETFSRAVGVEVDGDPLPVVISEVVADNKHSLEDGYGKASDWIELRNTGNNSVDLSDWGLSDDEGYPMKWTFPEATIAPHSTLIVFASGNDESLDPEGNLHANFSLDKDGESLFLTRSDGATRRR